MVRIKSYNTHDWVYGECIRRISSYIYEIFTWDKGIVQIVADAGTLGREIGQRDRNGNSIYTDDIVLFANTGRKCVVKWADDLGKYCLVDIADIDFVVDFTLCYGRDLEVVGDFYEDCYEEIRKSRDI